jgi:hypothetical protein
MKNETGPSAKMKALSGSSILDCISSVSWRSWRLGGYFPIFALDG